MIYYLADRPNPTRFINDPPLSLPNRYRERWRQEVMADLTADPPVYIVVAMDDATSFEADTSEEQLPNFPAFAAFLAAHYRLETTIGDFGIYSEIESVTDRPTCGRYFCFNGRLVILRKRLIRADWRV
jgi:hypothetical protein